MWRNARVLILAFVLALSAPGIGFARSIQPALFDDLFDHSDVVVSARVKAATTGSVNGEVCGTSFTTKTERVFKGRASIVSGDYVRFGRFGNIEAGETYLLFLHKIPSVEAFIEEYWWLKNGDFREGDATIRRFIRCDDLVPGYEYWAAWRVTDGDGANIGRVRAEKIPSLTRILSADRRGVIVSRRDLYFYLSGRENPSPFEQHCEECALPAATIPDAIRQRRNSEPV